LEHLKIIVTGVALFTGFASAAEQPKYTGPGSCSAVSCHGGVQPRTETSVLQNEYSIWVVKDKHAKAFDNLSLPIAVRMAKILGYDTPANKTKRCLDCHALNVDRDRKTESFGHINDQTDGVGCENCHGPASNWLGMHTEKTWKHEQSVAEGMRDLTDLAKRTEQCLTCHLGNDEKVVDHELIAAGHPDLYFELASFSAVMPRHWKPRNEITPGKDNPRNMQDPWFEVHELAVGQAVQLREQMKRIARESQGGIWPEYAEMDCFACHHSLPATKDSWRQDVLAAKTYTFGRRPGNPPYNMSRYVILRKLAAQVDPAAAQQLEGGMLQVYRSVTSIKADERGAAGNAAKSAAEAAERLVPKMASIQPTPAMTLDLMKAISGDSEYISDQGERAAEQAAMSLDALWVAYTRNSNVGSAERVRNAIHELFKNLEEPSGYNAPKFAGLLRAVNGML
jgi:hypothetical protein